MDRCSGVEGVQAWVLGSSTWLRLVTACCCLLPVFRKQELMPHPCSLLHVRCLQAFNVQLTPECLQDIESVYRKYRDPAFN